MADSLFDKGKHCVTLKFQILVTPVLEKLIVQVPVFHVEYLEYLLTETLFRNL